MPVFIDHGSFAMQDGDLVLPFVETNPYQRSPFVDIGARIVAQLQRAGWDVPGMDVHFRTESRGGRVVRTVGSISGTTDLGPFHLGFGNGQHHPDGLGEQPTVLAYMTVPPGIEAHWFSDGSGPSVVLFLSDDWKRDGERLSKISTYNAAYEARPKEYIRYSGRRGRIEASDDSREHRPDGDAPESMSRSELEQRVRPFLSDLLRTLEALPSAPGHDDIAASGDANFRRLAHFPPMPVPDGFPVLYTWIQERDVGRLAGPEEDDEEYAERGIVLGNGKRLVALSVRGPVPPRAYDGFSYASTDPSSKQRHPLYEVDEHSIPARIVLLDLNEIYVVDRAAFVDTKARAKVVAASEDRNVFSADEVNDIDAAVARTMVPASQYTGGYKAPVYLIGRRLYEDEARLMRGPIVTSEGPAGVSVAMADDTSGEVVVLYEDERNVRYTRDRARNRAENAALLLHGDRNAYRKSLATGYVAAVDEPIALPFR